MVCIYVGKELQCVALLLLTLLKGMKLYLHYVTNLSILLQDLSQPYPNKDSHKSKKNGIHIKFKNVIHINLVLQRFNDIHIDLVLGIFILHFDNIFSVFLERCFNLI
jgi:hypothetical protein